MGIGKRIGEQLKKQNKTAAWLARQLEIPATTIRSMISRDSNKMDIDFINDVVQALDCRLSDILPFDEWENFFQESSKQIDDEYIGKLSEIAVKLNHQGRKVLIEMAVHMSHDNDYTTPDYEEQMRAWGFGDYLDSIIEIKRKL